MSWLDDAMNTPEAAITEIVKDMLPGIKRIVLVWEDVEDNLFYRVSSMKQLEALGLLEAGKSMILDNMWSEDDAVPQ